MSVDKLNQDVLQDLKALKSLDVRVPDKAFNLARQDLSEYENLSIEEISDLLILLAGGV